MLRSLFGDDAEQFEVVGTVNNIEFWDTNSKRVHTLGGELCELSLAESILQAGALPPDDDPAATSTDG